MFPSSMEEPFKVLANGACTCQLLESLLRYSRIVGEDEGAMLTEDSLSAILLSILAVPFSI